MVAKIIKHELHAIFRVLVFVLAAALLFAVLSRISIAVDSGTGENPFIYLFFLFYLYAMLAAICVAIGIAVERFYRTMFTGEGYLTLAIPVSPLKLVMAKLIAALIAQWSAVLVCLLSVLIFFIGGDLSALESLGIEIGMLFEQIGLLLVHDPLWIVEGILTVLVSIPTSLLVFYSFTAIGQFFYQHRRGMTFLFVFLLCFVGMLLEVFVLLPVAEHLAERVSIHLVLWLNILLITLIDVAAFLFLRYVLTKRINLIV